MPRKPNYDELEQQIGVLQEEVEQFRELLFSSSEGNVTLTTSSPEPEEMSCDQLRLLLERHGVNTKGKKEILVARAEGLLAGQRSPSVVATRQALEAASPMLKSLLGSADTAHQPVQLPTESAEAAKLRIKWYLEPSFRN